MYLSSQKNVTQTGVRICGFIYYLNRGKEEDQLGETKDFVEGEEEDDLWDNR